MLFRSGDEIGEFVGDGPAVRSAAVLDGVTEVAGPVLHDEGRAVHEAYWGSSG